MLKHADVQSKQLFTKGSKIDRKNFRAIQYAQKIILLLQYIFNSYG